MIGLKQEQKNLKFLKEISSIKNEEDRKILEIIDRLDREYNFKKMKLNNTKKSRDSAEKLNEQTKELETQVSEQLKKRGQVYEEELRLFQLKREYENGKIDEEDIKEEDIDKLCKMYKKEAEELNADTERRKNHIAQMLKEFKRF